MVLNRCNFDLYRKKAIPVYDICTIDKNVHQDLLVERLETYLGKHKKHTSTEITYA